VTRSNRRPLVAGGLAAATALSAALLSACSAGQIAQTANINPGVPGANAQADGRLVFVRNAAVEYGGPKGYAAGADAPLSFWVFNETEEPITLAGVTATMDPDGRPVRFVQSAGKGAAAPCVPPPASASPSLSPSPSPSASPSAVPSPSPSGSRSASASPSGSASPSASPSPSPSAAGSPVIKQVIQPFSCVELSPRAAQYVQAVDLPAALGNQNAFAVTFNFTTADGQRFTVTGQKGTPLGVPVAPPLSAGPRPSAG
jgi:hypothetical protein